MGENITSALSRASAAEKTGYTYSYDMLGEAALTNADAERYYLAYSKAISAIADACTGRDIKKNPGISIKLSALFPRYELAQQQRVLDELVPRVLSLVALAKSAGMGLTIDAEEADRLSLSLQVIERIMREPVLAGWEGLGVVVQAYGRRAGDVIDILYALSKQLDRKITLRLVKGAYWDSEIKKAQVKGMTSFPVFTAKTATDVSYIALARRLLGMTDRIYPQFATHNAHTVAAVLHMAPDTDCFEFQRLHGMGEQLFDIVKNHEDICCRIYAPVGAHKDLLAYLVRRLLENGANSSFVNQIVDEDIPPEDVVKDPFADLPSGVNPIIRPGTDLFDPERCNSKGWDLTHRPTLEAIDLARAPYRASQWHVAPLIAANPQIAHSEPIRVVNPANHEDLLGSVTFASEAEVAAAIAAAHPWSVDTAERAKVLNNIADLYEAHFGELFALLAREAGKTLPDAVAEVREAVDFLRYYASHANEGAPVGLFTCISPWNFPLAIFTGQIAAALAAGNGVLAKPAEQTCMIAWRAVQLMHQAGVPHEVIQLLPGSGSVGAQLTRDARIGGVAFTGSTATAQVIRRSMAQHLNPGSPLIAETGGLNAMLVDSTALPEQAIKAVIESAFQSSGQRCSALRCLYVQEEIAEDFKDMLFGAMDELILGDPWELKTDSGPVIDQEALHGIQAHIAKAQAEGRLLKHFASPENGTFVGPTVIQVDGITDLAKEVFGPVLHLATFRAHQLEDVIEHINATGYGLTFGLQTRIDDRVQTICAHVSAGNIYVNRNQIGAIVGSQPFGGHGLSGTGPKAGGPYYLERFRQHKCPSPTEVLSPSATIATATLQQHINEAVVRLSKRSIDLPGPTGESNHYSASPRDPILCLGPGAEGAAEQAALVHEAGGAAVICDDACVDTDFDQLTGFFSRLMVGEHGDGPYFGSKVGCSRGSFGAADHGCSRCGTFVP